MDGQVNIVKRLASDGIGALVLQAGGFPFCCYRLTPAGEEFAAAAEGAMPDAVRAAKGELALWFDEGQSSSGFLTYALTDAADAAMDAGAPNRDVADAIAGVWFAKTDCDRTDERLADGRGYRVGERRLRAALGYADAAQYGAIEQAALAELRSAAADDGSPGAASPADGLPDGLARRVFGARAKAG